MKVAVTSASFATLIRGGGITHLEWLEACASRLDADGVVLALADFPRTDREYAAQLKKAATDLGLVPVAIDAPGLLDSARPDTERAAALDLATATGAALLRVTAGPPGDLPPETFARNVAIAKTFSSLAKAANITIAVAPDPASLLSDIGEVQNFIKYVDSAWLRYDLPANHPHRGQLGPRDRVLVERIGIDERPNARSLRGWLVLEGDGGADPFARLSAALTALRGDLGQRPQMPSVIPG
jgi:sugar phosphate isomerase/epimerase